MIEQEEPEEYGDDFRLQEEWLAGFLSDAPGEEAWKYLRRVMFLSVFLERIEMDDRENADIDKITDI